METVFMTTQAEEQWGKFQFNLKKSAKDEKNAYFHLKKAYFHLKTTKNVVENNNNILNQTETGKKEQHIVSY